jgi:ribosomal protein S18 acetylase RimI-like enzyme
MSSHSKSATDHFRTHTLPADIDAVEYLVRTTGVFSLHEIAIARELVEENLAKGDEASGYRFIIADGVNGIDGYTCFGLIAGTQGRYELYWIAVHAESRRSRLGQRLMQATEDAVRALGGVYVFAETSSLPSYEPARRFYLAQGYTLKGSVSDWHADGDGLEIYGKRLA